MKKMIKFTIFLFYIFSLISFDGKSQVVLDWKDDSLYKVLQQMPKIKDLQSMTLEDAKKKYSGILTKGKVDVTGDLGVGQRVLYRVFPEYKPVEGKARENFEPLFLDEITWSVDKTFNMTIWYKKDSTASKPVYNTIFYKGTMF